MSKSTPKVFTIILSLLLMVSMLAGCTGSSSSKQTSTAGKETSMTATSQTSTEDTDTSTIKYDITYVGYATGPMGNNTFVNQYLNEKYNVNLNMVSFERSTFDEQLNVKLASGDIPDFFMSEGGGYYNFYQQKFLAPFKLDFIKKNMPEWFKETLDFNAKYNCQLWAQGRYDGENNYILPGMQYTWISPNALVIRKDWMDNVGIAKVPETIDEFTEMLDKFTNMDPDKNNKKDDTYGLSDRGKDYPEAMFMYVFHAYGAAPFGVDIDAGGESVKGFKMPGYKLALKKLNEWYKKGYIDPEFITTDWQAYLNGVATSKIGVATTTWYRYYGWPDDFANSVQNAKGAEYIWVKPPKGPEGHYGFTVNDPTTPQLVFGTHLQKDTSKWARILKMLNDIGSDPETYKTVIYGKEGVNYTITSQNGVVYKPDFDSYDKRKDLGTNMTEPWRCMGVPALQNMCLVPCADLDEIAEKCMTNVKTLMTNNITIIRTDEINKDMNDISAATHSIHIKWLIAFITGSKSVDSDWDAYINELKDAGEFKYDDLKKEDAKKRANTINQVAEEINALR